MKKNQTIEEIAPKIVEKFRKNDCVIDWTKNIFCLYFDSVW